MIAAVTLDLDDTLWPIAPVMARAERVLDAWLSEHCPEVARSFPIPAMRNLRESIWLEHPHLAHDFTELRKLSLRRAFAGSGHDEVAVERAFEVFFAARNEVELYHDTLPALERLSARWPLASISNGNADLGRIGLSHHFRAAIHARNVGAAKPGAAIFHAAAAALDAPPERVAHVGDDPELDVAGAKRAGMIAVWLNRGDAAWPLSGIEPDLTVTRLDQLESALAGFGAERMVHAA